MSKKIATECQNCAYSEITDEKSMKIKCRRYPPKFISQIGNSQWGYYPEVCRYGWCGEFKDKSDTSDK